MSMSPLHFSRSQFIRRVLVGTVKIERAPTGKGELDTATGQVVHPPAELIYYGPGNASSRVSERQLDNAGERLVVDETEFRLPAETPEIEPGMILTVIKDNDPSIIGGQYLITRIARETSELVRRIITIRREAFPSTASQAAP